jgi:hypothetical protein
MTAHPNLRAHPSEQMLFEVPAGWIPKEGEEHWAARLLGSMYNAATMIIIRIRLPMHYRLTVFLQLPAWSIRRCPFFLVRDCDVRTKVPPRTGYNT